MTTIRTIPAIRTLARALAAFAVVGALLAALSAGAAADQEPGQPPTLVTLRGSSDGRASVVLGPVALHAGLLVLRARATSTSSFTVDLATAPPGRSPLTAYDFSRTVINSGLRYDGAVATLLPKDDDYYVIVSASGAFQLDLEQPVPQNVTPVEARSFTGEADGVTPVFALPAGTYTIHVTAAATARLFAWFYQVDDLGGSTVFDTADGRFLQQVSNGPYDERVTVTLRRPGLFLLFINAASYDPLTDPPTWSVAVE